MKKLIIDRSRWRTGGGQFAPEAFTTKNITGEGFTQLLNEEGYMCCLGFACIQSGVPKERLLHSGTPSSLGDYIDWKDLRLLIPHLVVGGVNTLFSAKAMSLNDDQTIDSSERERRITKHFAEIGTEVEFTGQYKQTT